MLLDRLLLLFPKGEDLVRCDATRPKIMHNDFLVKLPL